MEFPTFKGFIYQVAQHEQAQVVDFHEAGITPNFHVGHLRKRGQDIFVLCSEEDEWAFSSAFEPQVCSLSFMDHPGLSMALSQLFGAEVPLKGYAGRSFFATGAYVGK